MKTVEKFCHEKVKFENESEQIMKRAYWLSCVLSHRKEGKKNLMYQLLCKL